jgi:hypothetical protein
VPSSIGSSERNRGPLVDPRRTANRYLKRILVRQPCKPLLDAQRPATALPDRLSTARAPGGCSRRSFDYGDHDLPKLPTPRRNAAGASGPIEATPFSSYRSRLRGPHHTPVSARADVPPLPRRTRRRRRLSRPLDGLRVLARAGAQRRAQPRSTTFLRGRHADRLSARNNGGYRPKRCLPPVTFVNTPSPARSRTPVADVDPTSRENLPIGVDGSTYQWTDLHGEGVPGILTEQAGAWYLQAQPQPGPAQLDEAVEGPLRTARNA